MAPISPYYQMHFQPQMLFYYAIYIPWLAEMSFQLQTHFDKFEVDFSSLGTRDGRPLSFSSSFPFFLDYFVNLIIIYLRERDS